MRLPLLAGRAWLLAVLVVAGLVLAGWLAYSRLFAAPPRAEYRTAAVQRTNVTQTVAVSGSISSSTQVRLAFKSGGRLAATAVTVGQEVKAGDVLAKLDDIDQRIALAQAEANLASARAKYTATLSGDDVAALRLSVEQAQQTLNRLTANYAAAKTNLYAYFSAAESDRAAENLSFIAAQSTLTAVQNDLAYGNQYADTRTATTTANTIQANFQQAQVQAAIVDAAMSDLASAATALKAQVAKADAGAADVQAYGAAQTAYAAGLARAQSAVDGLNAQLATALTNANSIIGNLNTTATKSDTTLNQARTDTSTLAQQITTAQQQLISAKNKLGALTTALATITDAISGSSLANAQNSLASAKQSLQSKLNARDSDLQSASAALQSAQASFDNAKNALTNQTLAAPVAGVVAQVNAQVGEFVAGGSASNPFIVLSSAGGLALHGTVGEADIARIRVGQVTTITIDAVGTEKRFTGKVTTLDPVATIQQGVPVYGVDVALDVTDPAIRAGMSGSASVIIESKRDVLVVPNLSIRNLSGRRGVQVLQNGQPVDVTEVQFGIANDQVTEVSAGLREGDLVVLPTARAAPTPAGQIRFGGPGQPVR